MKPDWESPCGRVQLYCADCLDVLPTLGKVDAVVTDPQYAIPEKFGESDLYGTRRMQFHFDQSENASEVVSTAIELATREADALHCFCEPTHYGRIAEGVRRNGLTVKPWARIKACPPPPMPGNWWPSAFELAMYGYRSGAWFGDSSADRKNTFTCDGYRHGIRAWEKVNHPTQKWLPMIEYIVGCIVPDDSLCIDPFMGSGTTGVAAVRLGRRFIGIEIEPKYFEIAVNRIKDAIGMEVSRNGVTQRRMFQPEGMTA